MSSGRIPSVEGGIQPTIVDAKGDLIVATAADTVSRLAVGSNDQVLTADSSTATGLKWATAAAGGMTLLSTTTLSGSSTTVSGISGSYKSLVGFIYGINFASNEILEIQPNSSTSMSTTVTVSTLVDSNTQWWFTSGNYSILSGNTDNAFAFVIENYANATNFKPIQWYGFFNSTGPNFRPTIGGGAFRSNSAITSLKITSNGGANYNAGTLLLYGVS